MHATSDELDNADFVLRNDPKGMYKLTIDFPNQCERALEIATSATIASLKTRPNLVVLTGLGGSAIGGDIVKSIYEDQSEIPFLVNRDYHLPKFVNQNTLVFACSYSGNTEETLSAYEEARARGAQIIAVTSGGQLADNAKRDGFSVIQIPAGQPPRTALGYMLIPVLYASEKLSLIPAQNYQSLIQLLRISIENWTIDKSLQENRAKQIAALLAGKLTNLYGLGTWQGVVANRWKGEINENAKNMAFANSFPELNHNEVLGWVAADKQGVKHWVTIILEDGSESAKMKARARVTTELIQSKSEVYNVKALGSTLLEKMLYLILFGDMLSLYLAALNGIDPENIDAINYLKSELAKVK